MRIKNDPNAHKKLNESGILIDSFPFKLDKNTFIELGMGKGEMITKLATINPERTYIGIERVATIAAKAAKRAKELNLKNFFIILADIRNLPEILVGKVNEIWLTFSDPWPKARHEKRRLTHKSFLNIYEKILVKDGSIKFKTDNDKLFEYSIKSFEENGWKIVTKTTDLHSHPLAKENVMTGYEEKWSSKGKNINYLEFVR